MNALVDLYTLKGNPLAISQSYCFTCGGDPCAWPPFCAACRAVDARNRRPKAQPDDDLKAFALRAYEFASLWKSGRLIKVDAVDKAFNFATAIGLMLYDGKTLEEADKLYDERVDTVQSVLDAAFGGAP
jgi:hypothetical protein